LERRCEPDRGHLGTGKKTTPLGARPSNLEQRKPNIKCGTKKNWPVDSGRTEVTKVVAKRADEERRSTGSRGVALTRRVVER